jgi:hypothetical protein
MHWSELNWSHFPIQQFCSGMAMFYKITFGDYKNLHVILIYVLLTVGNMDYKIRHDKLTRMICTQTHTQFSIRNINLSNGHTKYF